MQARTYIVLLFALLLGALSSTTSANPGPELAAGEPSDALEGAAEATPAEDDRVHAYAGWEDWCAPLERQRCQTASDCPMDRFNPGRRMRCVHPYWAQEDELRLCVTRHPDKDERAWRRDRVDRVIDDRCSKGCDKANLKRILHLEALKESSWRPYARHRLNPDKEANRNGWVRNAKRYGHEKVSSSVKVADDGNPHYGDRRRWSTGLGLFGMNTAGFTATWDRMAPPEVLCREEIAVETWMRRARQSWKKIAGGVDCDGDGTKDFYGTACDPKRMLEGLDAACDPSWYDMHNAVNVGKLCPRSLKRQGMFARRAAKLNLDPYGRVRLGDLGKPVEQSGQLAWADRMRRELETVPRN
jgi:hypothetical protein